MREKMKICNYPSAGLRGFPPVTSLDCIQSEISPVSCPKPSQQETQLAEQ